MNGVVYAGLYEWEEVGAESHLDVAAEHGAGELFQGAFQVGHGYALVDHEDVYLVEGVVVGGVYGFVAEASSGCGYAEGGLAVGHYSALEGRRLGSKKAQ